MVISVVIPVRNAGLFLEECLASVEAQTVGAFQVICIDDGSSDESLAILEKAQARWDNLEVYRQDNRGVSSARNLGLSHARGDYVLFVDADDILDVHLVERVLPVAHGLDADMTVFGFEEYWGSSHGAVPREMCEEPSLVGRAFSLEDMEGLSTTLTTPNVWRICWKRSFLEGRGLSFHEDLATSEDLAFIYEALFSHPCIALVNERLYRYRRDGGITLTRADRGLAGYQALEHIMERAGFQETLEEGPLVRHFTNLVLDVAEYAMGSAATMAEYRALYHEFQRKWRPLVESNEALIVPRYRVFWESMKRDCADQDYLFELYGHARDEAERLCAERFKAVSPQSDDTVSAALCGTGGSESRPSSSEMYARVLLVTEAPVARGTVPDRAVQSLRRNGHAVLPWSTTFGDAATALKTAVRSFSPTVVLGDRPLEAYGSEVVEVLQATGLAYLELPFDAAADEAYRHLKASDQSMVREGILCTQRHTAARAEQIERARTNAVGAFVAFDPSWPQHMGIARPGFDPSYFARTTTYAVYFDGEDVPSVSEIALRVAEGNTVLCESGLLERPEYDALHEALVPFAPSELSDVLKRLTEDPSGQAYQAQYRAVCRLRRLDEVLEEKLRQVDAQRRESGLPAVLANNQRAVTVGLYGWFGAKNFGDDLLIELAISRLEERYPNLYPWVIGADPEVIREDFGYEAYEPGQKNAIAAMLRWSRALVYCGGLLFDDPMAPTAGDCEFAFDPWIEPSGQAAIALLARGLGVRSVFFGGGAGPAVQDATRTSIRLMGMADTLFLCRDQVSCNLIQEAGIRPDQVRLRADLAYGCRGYLDDTLASDACPSLPENLENPYFVVSLRRWPLNPLDYAKRMAKALDAIVKGTGCTAVFVPFDAEDAQLHREVVRSMARGGSAVVYDSRPSEPLFFSLIRSSEFAVAMRLHCSILHHVCGKPVVGLNYNEKVAAHFEKVGESARLVELNCNPEAIANVALQAWKNREAISKSVLASIDAGARMVDVASEELYGVIDAADAAPREPEQCYPRTVCRHVQAFQADHDDVSRLRDEFDQLKNHVALLTGERDALAREVDKIHASYSFRLGRALLWLPSHVRFWLRKRKER